MASTSRCCFGFILTAAALASSSADTFDNGLSGRELHDWDGGWGKGAWEYNDDDGWSGGGDSSSSSGKSGKSGSGGSSSGKSGKSDSSNADDDDHEPSHWNDFPPPPSHFWHHGGGWPMADEPSGKSGKSGSSKGSKGSSDEESHAWGPPPGWHYGGHPSWGPPPPLPPWHGEWGQKPEESSGKSGKGSSKSSKSKSSKDSSEVEGYWIWVDDSWNNGNDDGWSSAPEPEEGSGKSGKSSGSDGGKSGKSDGDKTDTVDKDHWGGDGWKDSEQESSTGGSVGGWNSDGWDNDGHYKADLDYVRAHVTKLVEDSNRELIPKFLRLGFHDCVGGCDGCVDMNNIDNAGLDEPINAIYPIVQKFKDSYSRSDIWVMASLVSADLSIVEGRPEGLHFPMRYIGRQDCEGADAKGFGGPDVKMPSNHVTTHELLDFFKEHFDFDTEETVIIMGVHAVATGHRDISGFGVVGERVGWVFDAKDYVMDNRYYKMLVGDKDPVLSAPLWQGEVVHNEGGVPSRYQWYHEEDGKDERPFMTSADIALVRDLSGFMHDENGVEGVVECLFIEGGSVSESSSSSYTRRRSQQRQRKPACPVASETMEFMIEYKLDNELWLIDFERVLEKMLRNGYETS